MDCPINTAGTNLPSGDCTPNAGYHGVVSATTTAPFYATDGFNGANVQLCTSQSDFACSTDAVMICATKAGKIHLLACTVAEARHYLDGGLRGGGTHSVMNVTCNVRVPSTSYCVAGGARAPAHAEPELARQEHAHAPPSRGKATAHRQGRYQLEIFAFLRAHFDHAAIEHCLVSPRCTGGTGRLHFPQRPIVFIYSGEMR